LKIGQASGEKSPTESQEEMRMVTVNQLYENPENTMAGTACNTGRSEDAAICD